MRRLFGFAVTIALIGMPSFAAAQTFSDVPNNSPAAEAISYLKEKGILNGYEDGTFRPDASVNRAEAVKIIVAPLVKAEKIPTAPQKMFADVERADWFAGYLDAAVNQLHMVDGPPKAKTFNPENPVTKAEFLKMLLIANTVDATSAYSDIRLPLAVDVANPDDWFYPSMRYGVAASLTMANDDHLNPSMELTRAQVALFLYRFIQYNDHKREEALVSEVHNELTHVTDLLMKKDGSGAVFAAGRAVVESRGALTSNPDDASIKAVVKAAEAGENLVLASQAKGESRTQDILQLTSDAWHLAEKARSFSSSVDSLAITLQTIAKDMANGARSN